ncbi:MAG: peptidylprolyl isomerase [Fimbriimonadaceae bacterium]|nr:peptidylprolyl isomerase [Fimbriimonadaceae bacterium]
MNLLTLCIWIAFSQAGGQLPAKYQPSLPEPTKVVARVDGKDITAGELMPLLWDWRANEVLEDVIQLRLIKIQAEKLQVTVSQEEIESSLAKQLESVKANLQPGQDLEAYIREQGFPRSRLYLRLHAELLLDKIVLKSFDPNRYVEISTIIVRPKSEAASDLAEAIKKAQEAYDLLKNGSKWEDVLKRYANEPEALTANGRLGWRMMGVFPKPVQEDLINIKAGDYTRPAQTQNGIQIFRLDRRGKDATGAELEDLKNQHRSEARATILEQIRKDTKIERMLGSGTGLY